MENQIRRGVHAFDEAMHYLAPGGRDFGQIEAIVPSGINAKTLAANFFTSIQTQMQQDRRGSWDQVTTTGITDALLQVATLGLYPGAHGHVYVYPFKGTPTVVPGYKGMLALMKRVPGVAFIAANVVYQKEVDAGGFEWREGTEAVLRHTPTLEGGRGDVVAAYALCEYHGQVRPQFVVMTREEIDKVKTSDRSGTPWGEHYNRMARKSAIRQLFNLVGTDDAAIHLASLLNDASLGYSAETVDMSPRQQQRPTGGPVQRPALPMANQYSVEDAPHHDQAMA